MVDLQENFQDKGIQLYGVSVNIMHFRNLSFLNHTTYNLSLNLVRPIG